LQNAGSQGGFKRSFATAVLRHPTAAGDSSGVSSAVALGITGIVVSGVAGPAVSAWFNRRGDQLRFARDQLQRRPAPADAEQTLVSISVLPALER
jgi:hypothetical protein